MSDKTITGVVTWLRNWFYTKSEVDGLVATGGTSISIEDTDFFDLFDCVNTNFIDFTTDSEYDGNSLNTSIINIIYPVGSIYMSVNSTSPSTLFGGTWEQIEDKFLLASGTTYANGSTGGSADAVVVKHNHTQNPHNHTQNSHNHNSVSNGAYVITVDNDDWTYTSKRTMTHTTGSNYYPYSNTNKGGIGQYNKTGGTTATNQQQTATNQESGVDGTGKNMPPYLAVYVWKRTA